MIQIEGEWMILLRTPCRRINGSRINATDSLVDELMIYLLSHNSPRIESETDKSQYHLKYAPAELISDTPTLRIILKVLKNRLLILPSHKTYGR
jgi:hypothetical protein